MGYYEYLGLGPVHLQPVDSIAAFGGAAVPFVPRESGDKRYQLIGESKDPSRVLNGQISAQSRITR